MLWYLRSDAIGGYLCVCVSLGANVHAWACCYLSHVWPRDR